GPPHPPGAGPFQRAAPRGRRQPAQLAGPPIMPASPTPTPPELRVLAPADLRPMRQLLDVFGTAFDEPAADAALRPGDAYLEQLLGSPTFIAVAALEAGEVVGGLAGYVLPKF